MSHSTRRARPGALDDDEPVRRGLLVIFDPDPDLSLEPSSHCLRVHGGGVEQAGFGVWDQYSQAFSASVADVEALQLAVLDTLQHRLAGHAEDPHRVDDRDVAGWCVFDEQRAELVVDADPPGRAWGVLFAADEAGLEPAEDGGGGDAEFVCGFADGQQLAVGRFGRWFVCGDLAVAAQAADDDLGEPCAGGRAASLPVEELRETEQTGRADRRSPCSRDPEGTKFRLQQAIRNADRSRHAPTAAGTGVSAPSLAPGDTFVTSTPTWTTPSPTSAPPATRSPTKTSNGSRHRSTSTSRCSATSRSPCPTSSWRDNDVGYASSAKRLSERSCSITTGRPCSVPVMTAPDSPTRSPLTGVTVLDAMSPGVVWCRPDDGVAKLASIMVAHGVHAVVLARGDRTGPLIVTDLELVRAALERADVHVAEIAREPLASLPADAPLDRAVAMMAERYVAHLLATDPVSGDPAGIISSFDVAAVVGGQDPKYARMLRPGPARPSVSARTLAQTRVGDAMHPGVITCPADAPLATVALSMAEHRIHCVAVAGIERSGQHLKWGLIGDMDLVLAVHRGAFSEAAATIAATEPIAVREDDSLERVAALMVEHATSHVVVVARSGLPSGIVSTGDVAGVLASAV